MHMYAMLSQMYETAKRFEDKFDDPEKWPQWATDQIAEREKQFEYNLLTDLEIAEKWSMEK